ncbi:MAG: AAA family ATPase [Deltaproteobacteria bacterium]|nr:AAA family ATPase [Deltaproteobacteria bacterium]
MYLRHWGFKRPPFSNAPASNGVGGENFFRSPQHEEALNRLLYAVQYRKGGVMITGEVGCGKTTLVKNLPAFLPEGQFSVHLIFNPALEPEDLVRAIGLSLEVKSNTRSKAVIIDRIKNEVMVRAGQGVETVIVIDESHVIKDRAALDELRMLLNIQSDNGFLITLILVGQPPLFAKITRLHPLNERIGMRISIEPLDFVNTGKYMRFRLQRAGLEKPVFTREAAWAVYKASGGLPLRINNICDRSLLIGLMDKTRLVTQKIVNKALADLG